MQLIAYLLGETEYQHSLKIQRRLAELVAEKRHPPALLLLEHPHVYTFGRQGDQDNLLWDPEELDRRGISLHWTDRGGDVTYHGPGQLVGYPIIPLANLGSARSPSRDLIGYLRSLEKSVIGTLIQYGIASGQVRGQTGVWVQPEVLSRCAACPPEKRQTPAKIASIGVHVDARGVTRHGFALNVSPDMSFWDGIIACGLENQNKISMAMLLEEIPAVEMVARTTAEQLAAVLDFQLVWEPGIPPEA
jgi:lipoyl(octanoyl) transferase